MTKAKNTLEEAMAAISAAWGPVTTELADACRLHVESLAKASPDEAWLAELHRDEPASRELYRDPLHGFVLLAHVERAGLYRPPHDHGRSWVVYAVQRGESEMGTYARVESADGKVRLVKRSSTLVKPGQVQLYLPGDIHDTLCVAGPALLFRFTGRDLRKEDLVEHRVIRYVERDGSWTAAER
jgi:predicted metal-dependent enzyme (double-stranded beta helix superfamily)